MLPVQFILLLIITLIPGEIRMAAQANATQPATPPPLPDFRFALIALASLFLSQMFLGAMALIQARRAIRKLHEPTSSPSAIALRNDQLVFWCRMATIAATAVHLFYTPLPDAVFHWRDQSQILRHIPLIAEIFFLLPAVLAWLAFWAAGYYIESAARERAMPYRLAQAIPVHEMPSLGSFLVLQARHNFFPLLFVFVLTAVDQVAGTSTAATITKSIASLVIMFAGVPLLLTKLWSTTSLVGPLRQRLDRVAKLYRLRFRNILLWRTHNLMINAAILGWIPGARYFLMSDSLLETLSDRQVEAVFAHEVGHGIHWHIPWYIVAFGGAFCLASGVSDIALSLFPYLAAHEDAAGTIIMFATLIAVGGGTIALIAPRFEHQADWFSCRHMARMLVEAPETQEAPALPQPVPDTLSSGLSGALAESPTESETLSVSQYMAGQYPHSAAQPDAPLHPAILVPAPVERRPILSVMDEGTEVFVSALDTIVESSHRARERRGLMHPSINHRISFLRLLARDEFAEEDFSRKIFRTHAAIVSLFIVGIASIALAAYLHTRATPPASTTPASPPANLSL